MKTIITTLFLFLVCILNAQELTSIETTMFSAKNDNIQASIYLSGKTLSFESEDRILVFEKDKIYFKWKKVSELEFPLDTLPAFEMLKYMVLQTPAFNKTQNPNPFIGFERYDTDTLGFKEKLDFDSDTISGGSFSIEELTVSKEKEFNYFDPNKMKVQFSWNITEGPSRAIPENYSMVFINLYTMIGCDENHEWFIGAYGTKTKSLGISKEMHETLRSFLLIR